MHNFEQYKSINEFSLAYLFKPYIKEPEKKAIKSITAIPADANKCKVYTHNDYVYANANFRRNNIIEICPVVEVGRSALYDSDIRTIIFEVEKNDKFVIPFGYCQFYALADEKKGIKPNCTYLWDPNTKTVIIKALTNIAKGEQLFLEN